MRTKIEFFTSFFFSRLPSSMWGQWAKCERWKDWMECENGDNIFYLENLSFVGVYVYRHVIFVRTCLFSSLCILFPAHWHLVGLTLFSKKLPRCRFIHWTQIHFFRCVSYFRWVICLRIKFCVGAIELNWIWRKNLWRWEKNPIPFTNFSCAETHEHEPFRSFCYSPRHVAIWNTKLITNDRVT